jgi:tryptophan synthase alpha chain
MFRELREKGEGAFIPFVMLGDPDADESEAITETLIENGADALEMGIPFSDPVADGPVIQAAANRALAAGATQDICFSIIKKIRAAHGNIPIGLLVYANLVMARGADYFYRRAAESGADSVLVADVPALSAHEFSRSALDAGVAPVYVIPPNADEDKLREIAGMTRGYAYYLGRSGVTGADREMTAPMSSRLELLRSAGSPPIAVGFGISRPDHVRAALDAGADGAIAGSATVSIIAEHLNDRRKTHETLANFIREMKSATRR